jgi:hypothetical protein
MAQLYAAPLACRFQEEAHSHYRTHITLRTSGRHILGGPSQNVLLLGRRALSLLLEIEECDDDPFCVYGR